jgi:hypothetical protein
MEKLILAFALVGLAGTARATTPHQPPGIVSAPPAPPANDPTPPSTPEPLTVSALVFGSASAIAWKLRRRKD